MKSNQQQKRFSTSFSHNLRQPELASAKTEIGS
jgi:hypothetical protein